MPYSEAQRLANLRYRQKNKEKVNEYERQRYAKMKDENPDKYKARVEHCSSVSCLRSKERTAEIKHIRGLMRMSI